MRAATRVILASALEADRTVSPETRRRIMAELDPTVEDLPDWVGEREASNILGLPRTTLNLWRRAGAVGDRPFPFRTQMTVAGRIRYDRRELTDYVNDRARRAPEPAACPA